MSDGDVIVSTTVAQAEHLEEQGLVSFEIDRVDESMSEGWSVLVTGAARRVDDPEEVVGWRVSGSSRGPAGRATCSSGSIPTR